LPGQNAPTSAGGFDPFSQEAHEDPYPLYANLRAIGHPTFNQRRHLWIVATHDDVIAVLRDWRVFSSAQGEDIYDSASEFGAGNLLVSDPPDHRVLRGIVQGSFSPAAIRDRLEDFVRREVNQLVGALLGHDEVDAATDLAWALPTAVVMEWLELPRSDQTQLAQWQRQFMERILGNTKLSERAEAAAAALADYFTAVIADRRKSPRDDLLSFLARATSQGQSIGDSAVALAHMIFGTAIDTTASLVTNALYLLDRHRDERSWLLAHINQLDSALEEILRFESPVQNAKRTTTEEVVLNEIAIAKGSRVAVLFGSANRDETRYHLADHFNLQRQPQRNVAFGDGIHHCLGAPLARLEARVALQAVLRAMPRYEIVHAPERFHNHIVRGYSRLVIAPQP
jgi:hypothetical protein